MAKPMIVIATRTGYYGEKIRRPGERFPISDTAHFADAWMIDPGKPSDKEKARELETQYVAQYGPKKKDVSDEQLLAEIAQSSGAAAALRAENLKQKETIRALEAQLAAASAASSKAPAADAAASEEARSVEATGDAADAAGDAADAAGDAGGGNDGKGTADADAPREEAARPTRVTRRRG